MDNHESTAFTSVSSLIRSKPTQSIRSSREARDLYQALDQIFKDQREEEKQERFRPIDEDNGPSMLSCPPQSLPSPSSSEASQPTHGSLKRPISNDFLLPSSKTSCQSYKKTGQSDTFSHFLSSPSTPVTVRILFEAIGPSSKTIAEALIGEELKGAVTTQAEWITDIRMGTISNNRFTDLARRTFAQRGLAEKYRRWRSHQYERDVVEVLVRQRSARAKKGTIKEFLVVHKIQNARYLHKALLHGIKMLVLERLSENPMISAILNFCYKQFAEVHRDDLEDLCIAVRNCGWIMALVEKLPDWLEDCQAKYNACVGWSTQVTTPCEPKSVEEGQTIDVLAETDLGNTITATKSTCEARHDKPDKARDSSLQHIVQIPCGSTYNFTFENGSARYSQESIRLEDEERAWEMGINPYTLVFSDGALLSNDWQDVNLSQRENNAAQQQAYPADMWSAPIHGTGLLGPELNANYDAHASALGPPLEYLRPIS